MRTKAALFVLALFIAAALWANYQHPIDPICTVGIGGDCNTTYESGRNK